MAAVGTRVTVATTATALYSNTDDASGVDVYLRNAGSQDVFVGGSGVTTAAGFAIPQSTTVGPIRVEKGESLHGIVAATTAAVHVLAVSGAAG